MKGSILLAGALMIAGPAAQAQQNIAGAWVVQGSGEKPLWELVLIQDPAGLLGAAGGCLTFSPVEISNVKREGNTLSFQCGDERGLRVVSLHGVVRDGEIEFSWIKQVPEGVWYDTDNKMFGDSAPTRFTAVREQSPTSRMAEFAERIRRSPNVTFDRLLHADREPQNWLTYSGSLAGVRHSLLTQINRENVEKLQLAWLWQAQSFQNEYEATSLVVDGVLFTVEAPNNLVALDAQTGKVLWRHDYEPLSRARATGGGGYINRGVAVLGDKLFMGTLDAHLVAVKALNGEQVWDTRVAALDCPDNCYTITMVPLVVKDKVLVGVGGGEGPTRGFVAAYDAATGKQVWRFYTIPAPGAPGNETWSGDSWKTGGGPVWNTGTYDPELNLTYWGVGNPYPYRQRNDADAGSKRLGDNLYTESVVALDADTGELKWHYQFTPHDNMDWDSAAVPVLTEIPWQGQMRKVMLFANRNGLFYVLDRRTGEFLMGKPYVEVNWMSGFDEKGRPIKVPGKVDSDDGTDVRPGMAATNWYPPSYSARTGLFYIPAWERQSPPRKPSLSHGAIRAMDPRTGDRVWEFRRDNAVFHSGILTTASDLLFTGVWGDFYAGDEASDLADRYFYCLDARNGELLWQTSLGGSVQAGPMSYSADGKQYIAVAAGNTLYAFTLRK